MLTRRAFLSLVGGALVASSLRTAPSALGNSLGYSQDSGFIDDFSQIYPDSVDPVLSAQLGREVRIPNTAPVLNGQPNLQSALRVTPMQAAFSPLGDPITSIRDPYADLEIALFDLQQAASESGASSILNRQTAQTVIDILTGQTRNTCYDGFAMLNYNRGAYMPDHIPGEYKMKRLVDTGERFVSEIDGETHKIWEVTINLFWISQNFDSDTFLLRVPYEADPYDQFVVNWRIYSLIQEDLSPTTILNDGFGRIFHGFDSSFQSMSSRALNEITIKYPSLKHFRGIYNWGWGVHPPRIQFLQPVFESSPDGQLTPAGESFATRCREDLTIENISDYAPEKKAYNVAQAALNGASGDEIYTMMSDPDVEPGGTFREWIDLLANQRQLPPEAWDVLREEDGLLEGDFGDYDVILAYMNNEMYGDNPYAQVGTQGKGGVVRDFVQGGTMRVKVINFDQNVHYYRNVDFGAQLTNEIEFAFGNGRFSFEKFSAKPTYGVPKVVEMQWRTGWGYVPHLGIARQSGIFPRDVDRVLIERFTDQLGEEHFGYLYQNVSGYFRFNPPEAIRLGDRIPAGDPLRDSDGLDGVRLGLDTEGYGIAKMPTSTITTHPDQANYANLTFPAFLRNPGAGGDIIPPTPTWAPLLTHNPITGTLYDPDGRAWVDSTYFHGRPIDGNSSMVVEIEAPRASAQLFYQFDPLFHDNMIFSYHPRSDIVR